MSKIVIAQLGGIATQVNQVFIPNGHTLNVEGGLRNLGTGAFQLPTGTTAQRPNSPAVGYLRYNTTVNQAELWNGDAWIGLEITVETIAESGKYQRFYDPYNGVTEAQNPNRVKYDPYWSDVKFYNRDGNTTDLSGRHTIGRAGSAQSYSARVHWKRGRATLPNCHRVGQDSGSYLQINNNLADFQTRSARQWTLEYWVRISYTGNYAHHFVIGGQNNQGTFKTYWQANECQPYMYGSGGQVVGRHSCNASGIDETKYQYTDGWVWMVWQKYGGVMSCWLDGKLYDRTNFGSSRMQTGTPGSVRIGAWSNERQPFEIDEIRWTTKARYGQKVSIPIQSETWPTQGPP